jgi:hypothetical protein
MCPNMRWHTDTQRRTLRSFPPRNRTFIESIEPVTATRSSKGWRRMTTKMMTKIPRRPTTCHRNWIPKLRRNGYGSIPIHTIFRGLFTSMNPSYFDVNYRGTKFWHTAIFVCKTPGSELVAINNLEPAHRLSRPIGFTESIYTSDIW